MELVTNKCYGPLEHKSCSSPVGNIRRRLNDSSSVRGQKMALIAYLTLLNGSINPHFFFLFGKWWISGLTIPYFYLYFEIIINSQKLAKKKKNHIGMSCLLLTHFLPGVTSYITISQYQIPEIDIGTIQSTELIQISSVLDALICVCVV